MYSYTNYRKKLIFNIKNMEVKIKENILILETEIKMKHIRILFPLFKNLENWNINEIEILDKVIDCLFISINWENDKTKLKEFMDNLDFDWIEQLSLIIWEIMQKLQDKKK